MSKNNRKIQEKEGQNQKKKEEEKGERVFFGHRVKGSPTGQAIPQKDDLLSLIVGNPGRGWLGGAGAG